MLLNAMVSLRAGVAADSLLIIGLSIVLMLTAALTFGYGRSRRKALINGMPAHPSESTAIHMVAIASLLASLTGLLAIVS